MRRTIPPRSTPHHGEARSLGLGRNITRRDFVGATLIGSGAILLGSPAPTFAQGLSSSWNGYAGIGDGRARSICNRDQPRSSTPRCRIRDEIYEARIDSAPSVDDTYDLIIVGGGFAGTIAAYEFHKARPNGRCLVLDNQPVFGGEAKQNQMQVDGVMLTGPCRDRMMGDSRRGQHLRPCRGPLGRDRHAALLRLRRAERRRGVLESSPRGISYRSDVLE